MKIINNFDDFLNEEEELDLSEEFETDFDDADFDDSDIYDELDSELDEEFGFDFEDDFDSLDEEFDFEDDFDSLNEDKRLWGGKFAKVAGKVFQKHPMFKMLSANPIMGLAMKLAKGDKNKAKGFMNQVAAQKASVAANFAKMDPSKRMAYLKKPITGGIFKGRNVSFIQLRLNLIDTLSMMKPINTKLYNAMGGDKMMNALKAETGDVMAGMMGGGMKGGKPTPTTKGGMKGGMKGAKPTSTPTTKGKGGMA